MVSNNFYSGWLKHAYLTDDGRLFKNVPMLVVNYAVSVLFLAGLFFSLKDLNQGRINFVVLITVTLCLVVMLAGSLGRYMYLYPYRNKKQEDLLYTLASDFGLTGQLGNREQGAVTVTWNGRDVERLTVLGRKGSPVTKNPTVMLAAAPRIDFAVSNGIPNRRGRLPKPRKTFHWIYDMDDLDSGRLVVRAAKEKNPEVVETKQKLDVFFLIASMLPDMEAIPRVVIPRGGSTLEIMIPQWDDSLEQRTLFMSKFNQIFSVSAPYVWDFQWGGNVTVLVTLIDESTVEGMMHAVNRVIRQAVEQAALKGFHLTPQEIFVAWEENAPVYVEVKHDKKVTDVSDKDEYEEYIYYALNQLVPDHDWVSEWKHNKVFVNTWFPSKTE